MRLERELHEKDFDDLTIPSTSCALYVHVPLQAHELSGDLGAEDAANCKSESTYTHNWRADLHVVIQLALDFYMYMYMYVLDEAFWSHL